MLKKPQAQNLVKHQNQQLKNQPHNPPLFITFEGGEGVGKTTLIQRLKKHFEGEGRTVVVTREPGSTQLGEKIRKLVLEKDQDLQIGVKAELLLFLAARAEHIEEVILPALQNRSIVLCDRFNDSSIAYQGYARGLGMETVESISQFATGGLKPDLTFFLDLDPKAGIERAVSADRTLDRIESEKSNFHIMVREGFLNIAKKDPKRVKIIDASLDRDSVFNQALSYLHE